MMRLGETRVWRETSVCVAESVVEEREREDIRQGEIAVAPNIRVARNVPR